MNKTKQIIEKILNYKYFEFVSILCYTMILNFIFLVFMRNYNEYYRINFNIYKFVLSIISILALYKLINSIKEKIIRLHVKIIYLVMFIPIATVYMGRNFSTLWFLAIFLEIIIIIGTIRLISLLTTNNIVKKIKNNIKLNINYGFTSKVIYFSFVIVTIVLLFLTIYYNGWPTLKAFDFHNVYEIRKDFYLPKIANYLYTFVTTFILPFLLVLFLHRKQYIKLIFTIFIQLLFYLIKADKIVLLSIFLSIGVYKTFLYMGKKTEKIVPAVFTALCIISSIFGKSSMVLAVFVTRLLIIPANLKFMHFDFFMNNPKIGIVGTLLNAFLKFPDPYKSLPYQNLIAGIYLNNYEMYSNTGMLVEGFVRFGYIGLLIIPIIVGIILQLINYGTKRNGEAFIVGISIFPIMFLNEGYILPSLMFGGFLLLLVVCLFFDVNKLGPDNSRNKNVIILSDTPFEPDVRVYLEAKYLMQQGFNVEIVCLDKKNEYKDKPVEIYEGIKIKRIFCRTERITNLIKKYKIVNKVKSIIYAFWLLKFIWLLKKYLKNKNFKVLHCQNILMTFIGIVFFKDKEVVFDMREYYENRESKIKDFIIKKIVYYTQDKSDWIIYVNDFQKKQCKEKNHKKLVLLPNYPVQNTFINIEKTKTNKIRISYIGKVRDFPSLTSLIDSSGINDKIQIAIYGNGSEYERIMEYAKIQNKEYIMKGYYNALTETEKIYSNTDILFAVYSTNGINANNWKNAMPIKSFEAIITLTPIIAMKNTVLGDFVDKNNIGFTIKNLDEIKEVFTELTNNPKLIKEKIDNLKKIQSKYTWESIVNNLDKIYGGDNNE